MSAHRILTVDCDYLYPEFAAAYLVHDGERALFVDNNTTHSVPKLLAALRSEGLEPEQVEFLIITHVHLDHAGGTSALLKACPNATVLAHPRAAPHVIDPAKLVASAKKVYGEESFARLYGEISAVPAARVRAVNDGETIGFGSTRLRFLHTRGHANHHFCVIHEEALAIFTGDSFGLRYPALQKHGLFIFPTTSPTDFDPQEAKISVEKIRSCGAQAAYPTHFGRVDELAAAAAQLQEHLDFSAALFERARLSTAPEPELKQELETELKRYYSEFLGKRGFALGRKEWSLLGLDLDLNAAGIAFAARKKERK